MYCKISNIRHTKTQNLNDSHLVLQTFVFAQSIEARCLVENEDVVGAAPTGDAATTYEWLTVLLPMNVSYIRCLTVPPSHSHSQLVSPIVCVPGSAPLLAQQGEVHKQISGGWNTMARSNATKSTHPADWKLINITFPFKSCRHGHCMCSTMT